ncbi:MAG: MerR family transcriptional regulator [Muribaculaceae bacterium]|nr:MerR family transcriptional regulator [Muribaculaceae bacterium]
MEDIRFAKSFYKVREVVEIIGEPASTLRFWEKEFPELKPRRTNQNQRLYTPKDIELLEIIKYLLHTKGLKVEAAKEYLATNRHNVSKRLEIIGKLEEVKNELQALLSSLDLRRQKENLQ